MRFHAARPGYDVLVRGVFLDLSQFEIHALVQYNKDLPDSERDFLVREARQEVMFAIVGEYERGRRLGARKFFVVIEGDAELAELFKVRDEHDSSAQSRGAARANR